MPIEIHTHFNAPAEDVFDAWTAPELVKKWMHRGTESNIVQVITHPVTGGEFSVVKKTPEGYFMEYSGRYHEVNRPHLLSFGLESPGVSEGTSTVIVRINASENGASMMFLQTGADAGIVQPVWMEMFSNLHRLLDRSNGLPAQTGTPRELPG